MATILSRSRALVLAVFAGGLAVAMTSASAQQPASPAPAAAPAAPTPAPAAAPPSAAAAKPPPPGWMQGAPPADAATAKLAPVFPPPIPTAADKLPVAVLHLPKGFHIAVYQAGLTQARSLRVDEQGRCSSAPAPSTACTRSPTRTASASRGSW